MADDGMDEEYQFVAGPSKAGAKKRARADDEGAGVGAAGASKRGRADTDSDDDEYGLDEVERAALVGMNELQREMFLFEKQEKLLRQREKQQVLAHEKGADKVRASRTRPRPQTGTDTAIGRIAAAHAQREERQKRKQQEQKQQRARARRQRDDDEDDDDGDEGDDDGYSGDDEEGSDYEAGGSEGRDAQQELAGLGADEEEGDAAAAAAQAGARAEVFDEGAGRLDEEDRDEAANLEELRSIQLKRADLEAWHNEPFFEDDVKGCVVRISVTPAPGSSASTARSYMVARVADIVQRNSYQYPKPPLRTRKWLHLDDLTGSGVFRQQMTLVSNSEITEAEYDKAKARAQRSGKFVTKGDMQAARERLQHARTFKYDSQLVKAMLEQKRAAGKLVGRYAAVRARLEDALLAAQEGGKSEAEVNKLRADLEQLERQEQRRQEEQAHMLAAAMEAGGGGGGDSSSSAAALAGGGGGAAAGKLKPSMALALVNLRNRTKNDFRAINAADTPGSAAARAAAAAAATGAADGATADVFSRRHTVSKVYWKTKRAGAGDANDEGADGSQPAAAAAAAGQPGGLHRSGSSVVSEVAGLKSKALQAMEPSELIKVLDLSLDLSRLAPPDPAAQLPRRLLGGGRWYASVARRQAHMAGWPQQTFSHYLATHVVPPQGAAAGADAADQ